jgi:hypothetical protein
MDARRCSPARSIQVLLGIFPVFVWIEGKICEVDAVKPRLDHLGGLLSMQQISRDLRKGQREIRVSPAPWIEEPEPDAIGMATVVSGRGVGVLPVGLR